MQETPKHVAVFAFIVPSHAGPLFSFIRQLSSTAGSNVMFTFFSTAKTNESLFPQNGEFSNIRPYNVWDGLPEDYVFSGNPHEPDWFFLSAVPRNFKIAVAETGTRFSCLVTDALFWFGADMAEEMGVPWVPFWVASARALFVHVEVDNIRKHMEINGHEGKTLDFLPDFSAIGTIDLPEGIITGDLEAPIPSNLNKLGKYLPRATVVATSSFEELDPIIVNMLKSRFQFLNIGPFALTSPPTSDSDEHGCLNWLDKHEPTSVAYISFGSILITPSQPELTALAEALEESKIPYLWSFRGNPNNYFSKGFMEKTNANGKFVPWAPQEKILAHKSVGVFVTHCGWNSVLETIVGGVPMICRPFLAEQWLNLRTVEALLGIGLGIEGGKFTKDGTIKALKLILSSEEGKKIKQKVRVYNELAFNAVKSDGSSTENLKILVDIVTK